MKLHLIKFILFFLIISSFFSCKQNKNEINDWMRQNVKGKVKQVRTKVYNSYKSYQQKKEPFPNIFRFDTSGFLICIIEEMPMKQSRWVNYIYNNDSLWISQELHLGPENITPEKYFLYLLDENKRYIKAISFAQDTSINYYINYKYEDKTDQLIYRVGDNPYQCPCKIVRQKNEFDFVAVEYNYFKEKSGKCTQNPLKSTFSYNDKYNLERENKFDANQEKLSTISYEYRYDKNNNWTYRLQYIGDTPGNVITREILYY